MSFQLSFFTLLTPFSQPSHPLLTPLSPPSHTLLTPFSTPSHTILTPFSHPSHTLLTSFSHPSHTPLTPLSHPSHTLLTPFSHPSHTPLTPFSHPSHTPLTPSHTPTVIVEERLAQEWLSDDEDAEETRPGNEGFSNNNFNKVKKVSIALLKVETWDTVCRLEFAVMNHQLIKICLPQLFGMLQLCC